jgi:hypothetical protein
MRVQDAQREVRTVFVGGFWGQLVSSIIWLASQVCHRAIAGLCLREDYRM